MPITSILSSFEVVCLENSDEALTNEGNVTVSENYIGIYSSGGGGYKLYNKMGEFICTVSSAGQGPDEYNMAIYEHCIDEANNRIYLLPYRANKVLVFDLAGNAREHIPLPFTVHKGRIRVDYSKQELLVMAMPFIDTPHVIWKQDFQGNVIQKIDAGHFVIDPMDYSNDVYSSRNTDKLDFYLFYWELRNDSLFHYDEVKNRLDPVFSMKFSDEILHHSYLELPEYYVVFFPTPVITISSSAGISISNDDPPRPPKILIDKKTLRGCFVQWKWNPLGNIDGPKWTQFQNGYFVANMFPHELKEQLQKALARPETLTEMVRERIQKLNDSITEDDNNIIIYGKLN